jgi:hypothetical protein
MAGPVSAPHLLGRERFLDVIVDPIQQLINRGVPSGIHVSRIPLRQPAA